MVWAWPEGWRDKPGRVRDAVEVLSVLPVGGDVRLDGELVDWGVPPTLRAEPPDWMLQAIGARRVKA